MKKYFGLLLALLLCPMFSVHALDDFEIVADDKATSVEEVNGSSVLAGNNVEGNNTVKGVGMLFGNNVNFKGNSDYGVIGGNILTLSGTINNDGLVLGNTINFESSFNINRDLFIFANEVTIDGNYNRNVTVFASTVTVKGNIIGNLTINASKVTLEKDSKVNGLVKYNEDAEYVNNGTKVNVETTESLDMKTTYVDNAVKSLLGLVSTLVVFVALALIVPGLFKRIENKTKGISAVSALALIGYGALLLIMVPLVAVLLISFIFGAGLGLLLTTFYIMGICLSTLFSGYFLGNIVWDNYIKKEKNILLVGLLGITAIELIKLVPIVGGFVTFFSLLLGLGLIFRLFKKD